MNKVFRGISTLAKKAQNTFSLRSTRQTGGYTYFFGNLDFRYNTRNFAEFIDYGYGQNPYVYAVVDKISSVGSSLPHVLTDREGNPIETPIPEEFMEALPTETYYKLFTNLLVTGNALLIRNETEIPGGNLVGNDVEYFAANIQDTTIQTANSTEYGLPIAYTIQQYGTFPASDVLHIKFPNVVELSNWGLSPLYAGQAVYSASNDLFTAKAHLFKNRGISGIISAKDTKMPMLPDDQKELQKNWQKRTAGADKFGMMHITTGAVDVHDFSISSKELELSKHNISSLRDVCRLYKVDPAIMGDPESSTYNNREQAEVAFYKNVILPLSKMMDKAISEWMLPEFGVSGSYWMVDQDKIEILNKPDQELSTKVIAEVDAGILTQRQAFEILYPEMEYQESEPQVIE